MEILFLTALLLLIVALTWMPIGILTLKTYIFLSEKEIASYSLTPDMNRSIVICGWVSFIILIVVIPIDIIVRPFAEALTGRIKGGSDTKSEARDN